MAWTHRRILYRIPNTNNFLPHHGGQADASEGASGDGVIIDMLIQCL